VPTSTDHSSSLVRAEDIGEKLAVGTQHVYRLWRTGVIPGVKVGKRAVRFDLDAVLAALRAER
jgi:excisionase family DNA binding protein